MLVAHRYVVRGRVQGVGFRAFVQEAGAREGLRGWVCNREDGSVEMAVEGEADAMARFARAIASGPARARVTGVERHAEAAGGHLPGFRIR